MSAKKQAPGSAPLDLRYELVYKNAMKGSILRESARFFSENYGTISGPGGGPATIDAAHLKRDVWPSGAVANWQDLCLIQAYLDSPDSSSPDDGDLSKLVGQAFVVRWRWTGREVLWVPQVCVARAYRRRGIARGLLAQIRDEDPVLYRAGIGILIGVHAPSLVGLHAVVRALAKDGKDIASALQATAKLPGKLADALRESPFDELLRDAKVVEEQPNKESDQAAGIAVLHTYRFVEDLDAGNDDSGKLAEALSQAGIKLPERPEGYGYAVIFEGI